MDAIADLREGYGPAEKKRTYFGAFLTPANPNYVIYETLPGGHLRGHFWVISNFYK